MRYYYHIKCEIHHIIKSGGWKMNYRYGLLGFLSLIGLLGFITKDASYYPFFAFALFFEYFFVKTDEMFLEHMRKAASWAFYTSLFVTTVGVLYLAIFQQTVEGILLKGVGGGFASSLIVFSLATTFFEWKDHMGVTND